MIVIKHILGLKSSYIDLNNDIYGADLLNQLKNNYIKYDENKEFVTILHTNEIIYNNDEMISLDKLKNGILILTKNMMQNYMVYHKVKSQYDEPYNRKSNQCTWVTSQFLENKRDIIDAIQNNDHNALSVVYDRCLENGTTNRERYGTRTEGENIDMLPNFRNIKKTIYGDVSVLSILGADVASLVVKNNIPYVNVDVFFNTIRQLNNNQIIAINRDGQTFGIVRVDDLYYVLDSHKRSIFRYDFDKVYDYVIEGNQNGFFYILFSSD